MRSKIEIMNFVKRYNLIGKPLLKPSLKHLLFLSAILCVLAQSCKMEDPSKDLNNKINELEQSLDSLKNVNQEMKTKLDSLLSTQQPQDQEWFDPNIHASRLVKQGISNPAQYIMQSLQDRTELIPMEGVHGGNMAFRKMELLGEKWVIAEFDDGHILGRAIYAYNWNKGSNKIEFKLLDSNSQ